MKIKYANKIYDVLYTMKVLGKLIYAVEDEPNHIDWLTNVEVINEEEIEQKYVPLKFNVGDWIVYNGTICKIYKTSPDDKFYHCFDSNDNIHIYNRDLEDKMHLWTIEDAKPGDLLDANGTPFIYKKHDGDSLYFYCGIDLADKFVESEDGEFWSLNYKVCPLTKEQKDIFFLKMKKSGFEWDEEKKELKNLEKKNEQKLIWDKFDDLMLKDLIENEQKLIWDKFDDLMLKDLIEFIESGWSGNGKSHLIYWLKSIKNRIK